MTTKTQRRVFIAGLFITLAPGIGVGAPKPVRKANATVQRNGVTDVAGDFLKTYVGPKGGDLDVASAQVTFTGTDFLFSGTMQAPIGTTPLGFYVWGVDRGAGAATADFTSLDLPKIVFDLVVVAIPGEVVVVNDLTSGIATPLPPTNITVSGNSITARVPLAMLESKGLKPEQYMWNLWPRWDGVPFGDPQVSDFAPADRNAIVMSSEQVTDVAGDFLKTYVGPKGGDLDVVASQVTFTGTDFLFSGTMKAPIGTTPLGFYVWGVDRGAGAATADFTSLDLPNIVFDLVVVVIPGQAVVVNDLTSGIATPLPPTHISVSGNNILARVPLSMLESKGLNPEQYMWNLWPRWDGVPFGDPQVSDFAPADRNAIVKSAEQVTDPAGDFLRTYVGPKGGDLDVADAQVTFTGTDFLFSGTMRAPIGTTPLGFYVWGVDRGAGAATADFTSLDLPNIVFDLVVVVIPGQAVVVNDLTSGIAIPLPRTNITINGNNILARVPLSLLESKGLNPEQYMWNLWPRWDGVPFGDPQVSDFAPADRNAIVLSSLRVTDPAGDFLKTYVGPKGGDLDVDEAQVTFTGTDFLFSGTMKATIGTTPKAFYVWGVDRGAGAATADFTSLDLPNIVFDLVVVVIPGEVVVVNDLTSGIATPLPPTNITINGNNILARVPLSMLESKGLNPEQYMWNLWPRWDGVPFGDPQVSDFAPADRNSIVTVAH